MTPTRWMLLAVFLTGVSGPATATAQPADRWTGTDKALHFGVAAVLSAGSYGGSAWLWDDRKPRLIAGLSAGIGASAAKEWRDRHTGGDPSWKDFTAGVLGTAVGTTLAWLVDRAVSRQPRSSPYTTTNYQRLATN
jgi:putative lipoprotein